MASAAESISRSPFMDNSHNSSLHTSIPILSSTSVSSNNLTVPGDAMDITPSNGQSMGPPNMNSPSAERGGSSNNQTPHASQEQDSAGNGNQGLAIGAAAAAQQPKVVQTAFIHKLYNMLEDQTIQHLISWSSTNESFVMSPSGEFSKVLSSYFKHTNISSFVRQLNMYGFHKVSDVFHTGSPDSPLWEFKHGNGSFKRGDLVGLREIKRRASRHALIHRDSFPNTGPKTTPVPPPGAPVEAMPDSIENRLNNLEQHAFETNQRQARYDDSLAYLYRKCEGLTESLVRSHQFNIDLTELILKIVPDPENPIHRNATMMRHEVAEQLKSLQEPQDTFPSARHALFGTFGHDTGLPLSPRQLPRDDSRRPSLASINLNQQAPSPFRAPPAPHGHLAISPRRYGSIGTGAYSPSSGRTPIHVAPPPPPPPQPPSIIQAQQQPQQQQHPLATSSSSTDPHQPPANLSRRHTSADIRLAGWNGHGAPPAAAAASPFASGHNSTQWPSSPHRGPLGADQQIRDQLAAYEFNRRPAAAGGSRQHTPPPPGHDALASGAAGGGNLDAGWSLPGAKYPFRGLGVEGSAPPTRRSSMASNVHSLLNPAETAEREGEDEPPVAEERKRKRLG